MSRRLSPIAAVGLPLALGLLLGIAGVYKSQPCVVLAGDSDAMEETRPPQDQFQFRLFTLDAYYNETKLRDRLKLSKSYLKYIFKSRFIEQRFMVKVSIAEELMRCESLTLAHPEMESLVACKSLEAQVLAEGLEPQQQHQKPSSSSKVNYVKKSTIKLKHKPDVITIQYYPLQRDFTQESVKVITSGIGFRMLDYGEHATSRGHYFELSLPFGARCSGNMFTVFNQSRQAPSGPTEDRYPEIITQINFFLQQYYNNGGLVSLQDVSCEYPNSLLPTSLDIDFTLVRRMQFPYVACRHTMKIQPMSFIWSYEGVIKQEREETSQDDSAYDTTIRVTSESSIFEYLQFALDQTFVNTDLNTGFEQMVLAHPLVKAVVQGNWSIESFVKSLELYLTDPTEMDEVSQRAGITVLPNIRVDYQDDPKQEYVSLGLKLTRDIVDRLRDSFFMTTGNLLRDRSPDELREAMSDKDEIISNSNPAHSSPQTSTKWPAHEHTEL